VFQSCGSKEAAAKRLGRRFSNGCFSRAAQKKPLQKELDAV